MAETGAVFDVAVPDGPARTPEQVMGAEGGTGEKKDVFNFLCKRGLQVPV
jgi:hypothetical protein